jgi:hypothetical protein
MENLPKWEIYQMRFKLPSTLLGPGNSYWGYVLKSTLAIEVPGWLITSILIMAHSFGLYHPDLRPSPFIDWSVNALVLVGPVMESFVLAGLASLLSIWLPNPVVASTISGITWGALHAWDFGLSFFCPAYGFFIMTLAYLTWRPHSFWHGYVAAMVPHLVHDLQWKILTLCS